MAKFTSNKVINTRWRNNDFVGAAGSSHTLPDAFYDEFLVDWAYQISLGDIVITETPTTGNIQMSSLTVGNITLTGTATGFPGAPTIVGTSPINVVTASGTSTVSLNANYQTAGTYVTSVSGTAPITTSGTTAVTVGIDQSVLTVASATNAEVLRLYVKNTTGTTLNKGQPVYISGSDGNNANISLASATNDATSSKTLGLLAQTLATGDHGYVIENGLLTGIDTSTATAGQAVWLSTTAGQVVYGTPPAEPAHGVYLGVVTRVHSVNGAIAVKVQNGYEIDELHDVSAGSPSDGDIIQYKTSSALWTKQSLTQAGIASSTHNHNGTYQPAGTYVTAVSGTAPIAASTTTAGVVSVSLTASYASSTHTHATSDVNSGNFVATLGAGTGVTVTGADGNAAAKTVAIGQAVATSDAVTFASVNKLAITAPATSATLAIANAKTLTVSNTMTLTGVDSSSANIGNGGALVPAGVVHIYMGANTSLPVGWLLCDGTAVSRTTYATLFGVIGTNFGTGDGSTTFNLPDLTGNLLVGSSGIPGTSFQAGTTDAYANASWTHNHSHSHVTNPAATTSGGPSATTFVTLTGSVVASSTHTHSTDIAATTSDTDATNSPTITVKRTRVNYIIKW